MFIIRTLPACMLNRTQDLHNWTATPEKKNKWDTSLGGGELHQKERARKKLKWSILSKRVKLKCSILNRVNIKILSSTRTYIHPVNIYSYQNSNFLINTQSGRSLKNAKWWRMDKSSHRIIVLPQSCLQLPG